MSEMKRVTLEEFLMFEPCWLKDDTRAAKLREIGERQESWTALDVLRLPDAEVSTADKLWAVLREEFIPAPLMHEIACRCAEYALSLIDNPDPRSIAAIAAKRAWLRGEIDDGALDAAREAAREAAWYAAWDAAWDAAREAAREAAWYAAWDAARDTAREAARDTAREAARDTAREAARDTAWDRLFDILIGLLRSAEMTGGEENKHVFS